MKKNLPDWELNRGPSDPQPSTYPLSYRALDIIDVKINFYILPQALDQYWSTLVFFSLYILFPKSAPTADSEHLKELDKLLPGMISAGEERTMANQALVQLIAVGVTLSMALVTGAGTGEKLHELGLLQSFMKCQYLLLDTFF